MLELAIIYYPYTEDTDFCKPTTLRLNIRLEWNPDKYLYQIPKFQNEKGHFP